MTSTLQRKKILPPAARYDVFAEKQKLDGELQMQGERLEVMSKW